MLKTILRNWVIPAIVLILTLCAAYLFGAGWATLIVGLVFCLTLAGAMYTILQEQRKLYGENRISRGQLVRNALFQIAGILLAMALASVLGRWMAAAATQQIGNGLVKFIAAMIIGLLTGMGVGFLIRRIWDRQPRSTA